MGAILKRELSSYFNSAIAYVVLAAYFFFSGCVFLQLLRCVQLGKFKLCIRQYAFDYSVYNSDYNNEIFCR